MLANRSTRIKVVESGKPPKVIPNATINFNLDYNSLKHMVKLAIRLSPEDPSYDVESITVHGKSSDYVLTPDAMDVAKTAIKALPVASSYMIAITVHVSDPTPLSEESTDENAEPLSNTFQRPPSPKRNFVSPSRSRLQAMGHGNGEGPFQSPTGRQASPTIIKRPSPSRVARMTSLSSSLSSPAATVRATPSSPNRIRSMGSPNRGRPAGGAGGNSTPSASTPFRGFASPTAASQRAALPVTAPTRNNETIVVATPKPQSLDSDMTTDVVIPFPVVTNDICNTDGDHVTLKESENMVIVEIDQSEIEVVVNEAEIENETYESMEVAPMQMEIALNSDSSIRDINLERTTPNRLEGNLRRLSNTSDFDDTETVTIQCTWRDIPGDNSPLPALNSPMKTSDHDVDILNVDDIIAQVNSLSITCPVIAESVVENFVKLEATSATITESSTPVMTDQDVMPLQVTLETTVDPPHPAKVNLPSTDSKQARKGSSLSTTQKQASIDKPLYTNGMTGGEMGSHFDNNMRNYESGSHSAIKSNRGVSPATRNGRKSVIDPKTPGSVKTAKGAVSLVKEKGGDLSPLFMTSLKDRPEGRPSVGTMERQWEFMRSHFVNNADDELEWLMVSKKKGAYKHAHRKNGEAEDRYFKSLYDIDRFEKKVAQFSDPNAPIQKIVNEMAALNKVFTANPKDDAGCKSMNSLQEKLVTLCNEESLSCFTNKTAIGLRSLIDLSVEKAKIARKARELGVNLPAEVKTMQSQLASARLTSDEALEEMEKWAKREKEADEYQSSIRKEEIDWFDKELSENMIALSTMRSYIPVNIAELSVTDLVEMAAEEGGLLPLELALEIKNNRLLHWCVAHKDDITFANFLAGDKKQCFENIEVLDIVELRALSVCLPEKFELDPDGKKADWRFRIMSRTKQMVSQFNGDLIKGGWNGSENRRALVKMPPLKPEQERRALYFYKTKEQCKLRLKQYEDKQNLLNKKQGWLTKAESEAEAAKKEYDTILNEMRDPDLKTMYGADQFAKAKDIAKTEWKDADNKRKNLLREVASLKSSIAAAPITEEQFVESMRRLEEFLSTQEIAWNESNQAPILVDGVFDPSPDIQKMERVAAKFVTAEEEAEQRKLELSALTAKKLDGATTSAYQSEAEAKIEESRSDLEGSTISMIPFSSTESDNGRAIIDSIHQKPVDEKPAEGRLPSTPGKRNSILATANPDMINMLNKIFSPSGGSNRASMGSTISSPQPTNRRGSVGAPILPLGDNGALVTKEVKSTRSKLLQKLFGGTGPAQEESHVESPKRIGMPIVGGISFLDQIKARSAGESGPPKISFLDQIKAAKKPDESADRSSNENDNPQQQDKKSTASTLVSEKVLIARPPMMAVPVNFLDAIKARRRDE